MNTLKGLLTDKYRHLDLRDFEVEKILREKSMVYDGKRVSVQAEADAAIQSVALQVQAFASQKWRSPGQMEMILITGGASKLAGVAIAKAYPQAVIDTDPIFSNARGYRKYAQRLSEEDER